MRLFSPALTHARPPPSLPSLTAACLQGAATELITPKVVAVCECGFDSLGLLYALTAQHGAVKLSEVRGIALRTRGDAC